MIEELIKQMKADGKQVEVYTYKISMFNKRTKMKSRRYKRNEQ